MSEQRNTYQYPPYPEYPYSPPISGIFHELVPDDASIPGSHSVYIPESFQPCSGGIMIFTPNGTSARSFLESPLGQTWMDLAYNRILAIIVVEPYQADEWNLNMAVNMRDDDTYLHHIYDTLRFFINRAAFVMDERAFYIVGYDEGGSAAHKWAMRWPQFVAGLVSVNGSAVPEWVISHAGGLRSFPFLTSKVSDALETVNLLNGNIPVPVWMVALSDAAANNEAVKQHWITAADAVQTSANEYAQEVYENGTTRIWATVGRELEPETLYDEFLSQTNRFPSEPGGESRWTVNPVNENGKGFLFTEQEVDGLIRRWLTYVPASYNGTKPVPLVFGFHGGTNQGINFAGDSLWHDVAEQYGFIVVYPTAYLTQLNPQFIPFPFWNHYGSPINPPPTEIRADDVAFIKKLIDITKQNYNIDEGRIFASGHSSGGAMTWRLGIDVPELFAGISPAGIIYGSFGPDDEESIPIPLENPIPVWLAQGQYDYYEADRIFANNPNDYMLNYWSVRNGFDRHKLTDRFSLDGRNYLRIWTNGIDDIPLFTYMTMHNCTHVHRPAAIETIWTEFFSKLSLGEDGKRYYDGREISRNFVDYIRHEEADRLRYSEDWTTHSNNINHFSNGRCMETRKDGATFEFAFDGNAFRIISYKGVTQNTFDVYIDDEFVTNVDTYNPGFIFKAVVFETDSLIRGVHKVRLVAHTIDSNTRYRVSIDAIDIKGRMLNIWGL